MGKDPDFQESTGVAKAVKVDVEKKLSAASAWATGNTVARGRGTTFQLLSV